MKSKFCLISWVCLSLFLSDIYQNYMNKRYSYSPTLYKLFKNKNKLKAIKPQLRSEFITFQIFKLRFYELTYSI